MMIAGVIALKYILLGNIMRGAGRGMMCSCGDGGNADTATFCLLAINQHIMLRPGKRQVSGK